MLMRLPSPTPHMVLAKSPRPSAESKRGAFERRNKKTAGQVRLVMFDAMKFRFDFLRVDIERGRQSFGNAGERDQDLGALPREGRHAQGIKQFGEQARVRIARNGDVIDVGEREAGFLEAVANGLRGKTGGVFYAIEAFFFDGGDELAVANERGGSVAVVSIDSQNIHERRSVYPSSRRSRRKVTAAPLVQDVQRPRAGPGSFSREKIGPHGAHAVGMQMLCESRSERGKAGFQARPQRAAQPFFPGQSEGAFSLRENFRRQNVAERFDEQSFLRTGTAARGVGQSADKFHQRSVEKRNAHFQRARHAHGIGVAQQCAGHVRAHLQPRNCGDGRQLVRFIGGALQPAEPGGIERDAIGADGAGAKRGSMRRFEPRAGRKKRAREKVRVRQRTRESVHAATAFCAASDVPSAANAATQRPARTRGAMDAGRILPSRANFSSRGTSENVE